MSNALEVMTFRLVTGCTHQTFIDANHEVNDWLGRQPGFISRTLTAQPDGLWLDVLHWQDRASAEAAGQKIMAEMAGCACMTLIDPASIGAHLADIHLTHAVA